METGTRAPRRRHSEELKARVLAACGVRGASVAAVAQAHGLNANLVHKWRRGPAAPALINAAPLRSAVTANAEFIPLALPAATGAASGQAQAAPAPDIRIEWRRGAAAIAVNWPVAAAPDCARWLLQYMQAK
jgi:transposase